jgi:hypothetical protein
MRPLAGSSKLGRFAAPDITPQGLAARGWDAASLQQYLATGVSAQAVASDEMLRVGSLSTSRLPRDHADDQVDHALGRVAQPRQPLHPRRCLGRGAAGVVLHFAGGCIEQRHPGLRLYGIRGDFAPDAVQLQGPGATLRRTIPDPLRARGTGGKGRTPGR